MKHSEGPAEQEPAAEGREDWLPIPTCEIEFPILEGAPAALPEPEPVSGSRELSPGTPVAPAEAAAPGAQLPRILRQAAGSGRAGGRVLLLMGLLGGLALLEAVLLVQLPTPRPLVVYLDSPQVPLMQAGGALK